MIDAGNTALENYKVKASDREYQFWERNPLSIDLWSRPVFMQKLNYMHQIPYKFIGSCVRFLKIINIHLSGFMSLVIRSLSFLSHYEG